MLWLIPWLAIALGFGATSTFATYIAVVRFGVIEHIVAFALRRGLRGLTLRDAAQGQPGYKVTRLKAGKFIAQKTLESLSSLKDALNPTYLA